MIAREEGGRRSVRLEGHRTLRRFHEDIAAKTLRSRKKQTRFLRLCLLVGLWLRPTPLNLLHVLLGQRSRERCVALGFQPVNERLVGFFGDRTVLSLELSAAGGETNVHEPVATSTIAALSWIRMCSRSSGMM